MREHQTTRTRLRVPGGRVPHTGYTDTAGYCFAGVVRTDDGRTLAVTVLGAPRSRDRWRDLDRIVSAF